MRIVRQGHITQADKARSDYFYIPFELPAPASRLHVRYRYSAAMSAALHEGGNVIDIGIFDPRGANFPGGAGFRGWSGSDRAEFTITPTDATPGYLPGPLPPGRYQIILGLYRIWPQGADYEVAIAADFDDNGPSMPATGRASADRQLETVVSGPPSALSGPLWLRGDLQSHTEHSDGTGTLAQLAGKARAIGLDFLAVTDHNTVSHHPHLPALESDDLFLIPGQEVTTYYGHMNVWGPRRWCDFRCRTDAEVEAVIRLAHAVGGLCSINHPKTNGPEWEYDTSLPVDSMEVWQGPWAHKNTESLALWEGLLNSGRRLPAVGGSDYHCPAGEDPNFLRLGQPTTWVKVTERSVRGVLDAIRAGRASISAFPDGPRLDLRAHTPAVSAGMGEELLLGWGRAAEVELDVERGTGWTLRLVVDGEVAREVSITTATATVHLTVAPERYLRAELVGDAPRELLPPNIPPGLELREWRWALSNPIYIRRDHEERSVAL